MTRHLIYRASSAALIAGALIVLLGGFVADNTVQLDLTLLGSFIITASGVVMGWATQRERTRTHTKAIESLEREKVEKDVFAQAEQRWEQGLDHVRASVETLAADVSHIRQRMDSALDGKGGTLR